MSKVTLNPYLFFGGNCKEAMEYYKGVFGGKLYMQTMGEMPKEAMPSGYTDEMSSQIMHASLMGGDVDLMASDSPKASPKAAKVELSLSGTDDTKLRQLFDALVAGGKVNMPLEKAPWGDTFGMLTDKYGIDWMVNISAKQQ